MRKLVLVLLCAGLVTPTVYPHTVRESGSQFLLDYGIELFEAGRIAESIIEFRKSLMVDPRNRVAQEYLYRALSLQRRKQPQVSAVIPESGCTEDELVFKADVSRPQRAFRPGDPDDASAYLCTYGAQLYREGDSKQALIEFEKALHVNPHNQTARHYLQALRAGHGQFKSWGAGDLLYHWDFGDGTTSTDPIAAHRYRRPGRYPVTLTISDPTTYDQHSISTMRMVSIGAQPDVRFNGPRSGCTGNMLEFDASMTRHPDPDSLKFLWSFGDNTTGEGQRLRKVYNRGGRYTVQLTVTDVSGSPCGVGRAKQDVYINACPVAVMTVDPFPS